MADTARRQEVGASGAPQVDEGSGPPREETRIWTDPRTRERWCIRTVASGPDGAPDRSPRLVVFRRGERRYWVGYCGQSPLARMGDTDLVLLLDSSSAAL